MLQCSTQPHPEYSKVKESVLIQVYHARVNSISTNNGSGFYCTFWRVPEIPLGRKSPAHNCSMQSQSQSELPNQLLQFQRARVQTWRNHNQQWYVTDTAKLFPTSQRYVQYFCKVKQKLPSPLDLMISAKMKNLDVCRRAGVGPEITLTLTLTALITHQTTCVQFQPLLL